MKSFVDADARRQLVVPLIYFWCGAIPIDVPLSGAVCGTLSKACPITSPPAELQTCKGLGLFFFFFPNSERGNCCAESSSGLQSVIWLMCWCMQWIWQGVVLMMAIFAGVLYVHFLSF